MAKYFIPFAIYFGTTIDNLYGQSLPAIQLDRPDQTECPFITPKKYIQIENGFTIENFDQNQKSYNYPSTLWKYGINEKFELRLITELVSEKTNGNTNTGSNPAFFAKDACPKITLFGSSEVTKMYNFRSFLLEFIFI